MSIRRLLVAAVLWFAGLSVAGSAAWGMAVPVELVAPRHGEVLTPGREARVEWRATAVLPHQVEEWEAFLSLDGGRSYPLRLTPHLDLGLHHLTFLVPSLPSHDARILLRFGDEHAESVFEMPARFEIAGAKLEPFDPRTLSRPRGEAARPGDRDTVAWVEGGRHGEGKHWAYAPTTGWAALPELVVAFSHKWVADEERDPSSKAVPSPAVAVARTITPPRRIGNPQSARPFAVDILTLGSRLNE